MNVDLSVTAAHWSKPTTKHSRVRWWQSETIVRHINKTICGKSVRGTEGGDVELLRALAKKRSFERAVSVGCGNAYHEFKLLEAGIVEHFEVYEIADSRIETIKRKADEKGLQSRITIRVSDAFAASDHPRYDLVYWKDSLHHMESTANAIQWSRSVLNPGGVFFMNEFVGPNYMQYSDRQLRMAGRIREALPQAYLADPNGGEDHFLPTKCIKPAIEFLKSIDPTECIDSANILPALSREFLDPKIILTGGVVYSLALQNILANFDEVVDRAMLSVLMAADDLCIESGESLYAVGYATRS